MNIESLVKEQISSSARAIQKLDVASIIQFSGIIISAFDSGNKVLICGNGGSAADAQHFAAELVGRYQTERQALPAIALTTDTSILTAISNDYGNDYVFARQVEALGNKGDVFIGISTSGRSLNVLSAARTANQKNIKVLGMTGANGSELKELCDSYIQVNSTNTARIQEAHQTAYHIVCAIIDNHYEPHKR